MSIFSSITRRPIARTVIALTLASSLTLGAGVFAGQASAVTKVPPSEPTAAAPNCLARVIGKAASGELQLSTPTCYATFGDVLQSAGYAVADSKITATQARDQGLIGLASPSGGAVMALGGSGGIIGTHFDGFNYTGSSFSVWGNDCYGGYINLTGFWANRVSSTINGCPAVFHYFWQNMVGTSEATYGFGGNLSTLNNNSESISYQGW